VPFPTDLAANSHILLALTLVTLIPSLLVMTTSFTRILVVLAFMRQALGTPTLPPNLVLLPLALILTALSMGPVMDRVYDEAIQPALAGKMPPGQAYLAASLPLREFMQRQIHPKDLTLLANSAKLGPYRDIQEVPLRLLVPAFMLSELRTAFRIGLTLFLSFLTVDLVVAAVLAALGLFMLPPMSVSLPLKLMIFVVVDGWGLLCAGLIRSFN
jgi:flagellar biosynthetic protein FliP